MNIIRNRLKRFVPERFYKAYILTPPIIYFAGELLGNDVGIGVHDICIERMPFQGAWRP